MSYALTDLTTTADLLDHAEGTGPPRTRTPEYVDILPPCTKACPAGEHIQSWLAFAQAGDNNAAWAALTQENPMPAIHGRVCYHPCETSCNRASLDGSVSIHAVERFLGDLAIQENWEFTKPAVPT